MNVISNKVKTITSTIDDINKILFEDSEVSETVEETVGNKKG